VYTTPNIKTVSRIYYSEIHLGDQNADLILAVCTVQIYASDTVARCTEIEMPQRILRLNI